MKDYTKYDFAAIVGAEVEIDYGGRDVSGVLVSQTEKTIYLNTGNNPLYLSLFYKHNIRSLTAKIKVEDMSVKQLKRFIKPALNWREVVMIAEDGVHHSILEMCDEPVDDEPVKSFTDYIDCTDWGWKK